MNFIIQYFQIINDIQWVVVSANTMIYTEVLRHPHTNEVLAILSTDNLNFVIPITKEV